MDSVALDELSLNLPQGDIPFPHIYGKAVIMTALPSDLRLLRNVFGFRAESEKRLLCSQFFTESAAFPGLVLCGGFMGAPQAAILLEVMAFNGARDFIFCGPCGSLDAGMNIGDIFLAEAAYANDGTTKHYTAEPCSAPYREYLRVMKAILNTMDQRFARGIIASTDGVFRETKTLLDCFKANRCVAVDMETAALFAVSGYLKVKMCSINVISDVFNNDKWLNGLNSREFKHGRVQAIETIKEMVIWVQKTMLI